MKKQYFMYVPKSFNNQNISSGTYLIRGIDQSGNWSWFLVTHGVKEIEPDQYGKAQEHYYINFYNNIAYFTVATKSSHNINLHSFTEHKLNSYEKVAKIISDNRDVFQKEYLDITDIKCVNCYSEMVPMGCSYKDIKLTPYINASEKIKFLRFYNYNSKKYPGYILVLLYDINDDEIYDVNECIGNSLLDKMNRVLSGKSSEENFGLSGLLSLISLKKKNKMLYLCFNKDICIPMVTDDVKEVSCDEVNIYKTMIEDFLFGNHFTNPYL